MKFEFQPVILAEWVEKTRAWRRPGAVIHAVEPSTLAALREEFEQRAANEDVERLVAWLADKPPRDRRAFARIPAQSWPDRLIHLWHTCLGSIRTDARTFWTLIDGMHRLGDGRVWPTVQREWERHQEALQASCAAEADVWAAYAAAGDPAEHVAQQVRRADGPPLESLFDLYRIPPQSPWYWQVFVTACKNAPASFFSRMQDEFRAALKALSDTDRQRAVDAFLTACDPFVMHALAHAVHEQMADPRSRPELWTHVGEPQRATYMRWLADQQLRQFFADDNERYQFWRRYLHHIDEVVVMGQQQGILLMSRQAVIVEGLNTGYATYVYSRRRFEEMFSDLLPLLVHPHTALQVKLGQLRRQNDVYRDGHLRHVSGWPMRYAAWLHQNLGWEAKS